MFESVMFIFREVWKIVCGVILQIHSESCYVLYTERHAFKLNYVLAKVKQSHHTTDKQNKCSNLMLMGAHLLLNAPIFDNTCFVG